MLLPAVLRIAAAASARSVVPAMAARNSLRAPKRTARATVGLLIAVTLMATFAVGFSTYASMLQGQAADDPSTTAASRSSSTSSRSCSPASSVPPGVIAAAGVVAVTALTTAQRGRELGLLRVVGATRQQVRALVLAETAITVAVAVVLGGLLGTAYGWAGAYTCSARPRVRKSSRPSCRSGSWSSWWSALRAPGSPLRWARRHEPCGRPR